MTGSGPCIFKKIYNYRAKDCLEYYCLKGSSCYNALRWCKWFVKALKVLWLKALWLKVLRMKALWRKVLGRKTLRRKVLWRKALCWKVLWGGITSTSNEGPVPTASWRPFKGTQD